MNTEIASKMEELQVQYDTEQKEKRIGELIHQEEINQLIAQKKRRNYFVLITALLSLLFIMLLVLRQKRIQSKQRESQLNNKLLRTQMNPHFIFNSLNSINSYIYGNQAKEASLFLSKFAKLMRNILDGSRKDTITLEQEIDTLSYYLQLEQLRFNNKFEFEINVCEDIETDDLEIPPMLIQPFIENSIKHGINESKNGKITLRFSMLNDCLLQCEISDNGVGINRGKDKNTKHTSYAMEITRERLAILNKKQNNQIKIDISDLSDVGKKGTLVKLALPV